MATMPRVPVESITADSNPRGHPDYTRRPEPAHTVEILRQLETTSAA
jgi:hypothetical protein